jgi:hypothetical protein
MMDKQTLWLGQAATKQFTTWYGHDHDQRKSNAHTIDGHTKMHRLSKRERTSDMGLITLASTKSHTAAESYNSSMQQESNTAESCMTLVCEINCTTLHISGQLWSTLTCPTTFQQHKIWAYHNLLKYPTHHKTFFIKLSQKRFWSLVVLACFYERQVLLVVCMYVYCYHNDSQVL